MARKLLLTPLITKLGRAKETRCFTDPPVLIGGCGRSGTTLLLSILDAHPHICGIREQTYGFMSWETDRGSEGGPVLSAQPSRPDRFYRHLLFTRVPRPARRWCEKTPMHVRHFEELLAYFGERVRLIHLVRDGRDVITSRHPFNPTEYWVPIARWVNDVAAGLRVADDPRVLTLKYEDLVKRFEPTIQKVCAFLGEEPVPEIMAWYEHTRIRRSRHWSSSVCRLHAGAIGRWREPAHRTRVEDFMRNKEAREHLLRLGYR